MSEQREDLRANGYEELADLAQALSAALARLGERQRFLAGRANEHRPAWGTGLWAFEDNHAIERIARALEQLVKP